MSDAESQSGVRRAPMWLGRGCLVAAMIVLASGALAATEETPTPTRAGPELFGADTPIGRIEYRAGRGLKVGRTGLTVGGFTTAEVEVLEGGDRRASVEGVNFFLFFDPVPFVHVFSEIEVGTLIEWERGRKGPRLDDDLEVDRLFADFGNKDFLNLRLGKFLTPIGQWNQVPAEPFVWTTSEPLIVEEVFDEVTTGAMLWGSVFPRGRSLSYAVYGTFFDPIAPDPDAPPADHSAGARLEWSSLERWTLGASYFASEPRSRGDWHHLGGFDALWRPTSRLELSGESVFGEGTREPGTVAGLFAQAVVETVPTLYGVGRYEWFDPPGSRSLNIVDVGLAWVPVPWVRLKADYRFADHFEERSAPGFRASFSLLF